MHIDKEQRIWFSKQEMKVITSALQILSYEMWKFEKAKKSKIGKNKFSCSTEDLKYVKDWFASLYSECKEDTYIFIFENASKRLSVIHTALERCSKNFKDYERSDLGNIPKTEINKVYNSFQELLSEVSPQELLTDVTQ